MSVEASKRKIKLYTRYINQSYVQSRTKLELTFYLKPPEKMILAEGVVLKVVRPLCGIPESGLNWYLTYLERHITNLGIKRSLTDPCLPIITDENRLKLMIVLQVHYSLGLGTEGFMERE